MKPSIVDLWTYKQVPYSRAAEFLRVHAKRLESGFLENTYKHYTPPNRIQVVQHRH